MLNNKTGKLGNCKMDDDLQAVDSPNAATQISNPGTPRNDDISLLQVAAVANPAGIPNIPVLGRTQQPQSKYAQLLAVIEDLGKDIRPTYAGSKSSAERLKRGIVHARILVRECLMETERSARN
uniref:Cyclin-dependent kinase 2-associated protein n=1 Tax=Strigamia maritima TaxID=126957 RepID=T1J1W9_STRMM